MSKLMGNMLKQTNSDETDLEPNTTKFCGGTVLPRLAL